MENRSQEVVLADTSLNPEPEIARWLWALQDTRRRTMKQLAGIAQAAIDWLPPRQTSTIGTILYHTGLIEADWLYTEVLEQDYAPDIVALFPYDDRDTQGHLTHVQGMTLEQHLERLDFVRQRLLREFQPMSLQEFRRIRRLPSYDVTPEWVLHHLMQHEAEHRSEIGALRIAAEQTLKQA